MISPPTLGAAATAEIRRVWYYRAMLIRNWMFEILGEGFDNFERLSAKLRRRGEEHGVSTSEGEIRVLLEELVRDGRIDTSGAQAQSIDERVSDET